MRGGEAAAAAGLQRLTNARDLLDREEKRAQERVLELDSRLNQFEADVAREMKQQEEAEIALMRLEEEDAMIKEEIMQRVELRGGVDERVSEAEAVLAAAERTFTELTTAHADMTAKRNQLQSNVRSQADRLTRLSEEIARVESEIDALTAQTSGFADLDELAMLMETAQEILLQAEYSVAENEAAHVAARQTLEASRAPLNEADKKVQRLETEARTISKILNGETKNLWPPIIDGVTVTKGYEKAFGAVLGDDLDAPVDPSAPMRWTDAGEHADDPALPDGVESLASHVNAPIELQ